MSYLRLAALAALALLVPTVSAQNSGNSFRGLYEVSISSGVREMAFLVSSNSTALCLDFDYNANFARSARFAINAAGQFDFTVGERRVTGTVSDSGISVTVTGNTYTGTRTRLTIRNGSLHGGYTGWLWENQRGDLGEMEWIVSPSGKLYVYFLQLGNPFPMDGGIGTFFSNGTFSFRSVIDDFNYVNATPAGSATDGRAALADNHVLTGSFRAPSGSYQFFRLTRENAPFHLQNVSTRGLVGTGDNVLIGGFVVSAGAKRVVIRVLGPSLAGFGVQGALANPQLEVRAGSTLVTTNDDWAQHPTQAQVVAAGLQPPNTTECAVAVTLEPGSYTAIVRGAGDSTGVAIVEVYEID